MISNPMESVTLTPLNYLAILRRTVLLGMEGEAVAGTLLLPVQLVVTCEP